MHLSQYANGCIFGRKILPKKHTTKVVLAQKGCILLKRNRPVKALCTMPLLIFFQKYLIRFTTYREFSLFMVK